MNYQFDIIVIGDSDSGNAAIKQFAIASRELKIAFISRTFKSTTNRESLNVEYFKDEVVFTDYKNRLFGCYLKNGDRLFCTHLVIATGLRYAPLFVNNKRIPCVFNTANDISKLAKNLQAVVIGETETDVKLALAVAKKYKYVYLCAKTVQLNITNSTLKKLSNTENIAVLYNANVLKAHTINNELKTVELDNYSTITCSAIFIKTPSTPETDFVSNKLVSKTAAGLIETNGNQESLLIPKCFAVGNCAVKSTKKMQLAMVETILNDFMLGM
jgi:thioredoxin reductase